MKPVSWQQNMLPSALKNARLRLWQLRRTSRQIMREQGALAFVKRLILWMGGARGYFRLLNPAFPSYAEFCRQVEPTKRDLARQRTESEDWEQRPRFVILTFLQTGTDLQKTARSVEDQSYTNWQWSIVAREHQPRPTNLAEDINRIRWIEPGQVAAHVQSADYVTLLDDGDQLAPHALYTAAEAIQTSPEADFVYADVDHINATGQRCDPLFKPDWSPEMMLSCNLLHPWGVSRLAAWNMVAPFTSAWDFGLRLAETAHTIHHIPQVLYHQTANAQPEHAEAALTAIAAHLTRGGLIDPVVTRRDDRGIYVAWKSSRERRVSIIIPSRDHPELIETCLSSLFARTAYRNYDVMVVDNGSVEPETHAVYARYAHESRFRLAHFAEPFNFSRACNLGADHSDSDLLLFLNNDTEILHDDWLYQMTQWFERPGVGVVGPKLLYPNGKIQHAGVVVGMHGLADNLFAAADEHTTTPYGSDDWVRNLLAVTGACLLVSRKAFDAVQGFDPSYQLVFSDVDLCLRIHAAGYRIVYTPHARLRHHECATHQRRIPGADVLLAYQRFAEWLRRGDPYYNPNLTTRWPIPHLRQDERDTPEHNRYPATGEIHPTSENAIGHRCQVKECPD